MDLRYPPFGWRCCLLQRAHGDSTFAVCEQSCPEHGLCPLHPCLGGEDSIRPSLNIGGSLSWLGKLAWGEGPVVGPQLPSCADYGAKVCLILMTL